MEWAEIEQYIISITPCLTAIISLIAAVIFAIKKCKSISQETVDKIESATTDIVGQNARQLKENVEMKTQMKLILKENAELKAEIKKVIASNVRGIDDGKKGK